MIGTAPVVTCDDCGVRAFGANGQPISSLWAELLALGWSREYGSRSHGEITHYCDDCRINPLVRRTKPCPLHGLPRIPLEDGRLGNCQQCRDEIDQVIGETSAS